MVMGGGGSVSAGVEPVPERRPLPVTLALGTARTGIYGLYMKLWTVDAFTDQPFAGNPAAEMNLSETAFLKPAPDDAEHDWDLRWFSPVTEALLCGHATLAAAHVLAFGGLAAGRTRFATLAGVLSAEAQPDGTVIMDFPANPPVPADPAEVSDTLAAALGADPVGVYAVGKLNRLMVELPDEKTVRGLTPDLGALAAIPVRGVIVTALADQAAVGYDFVSRYFAPRAGIPEDPVTGSAHTTLAPFWGRRLGRTVLTGLQVSARTGLVSTEVTGDRVLLTGRAVTVLVGELLS
jgi:PhzF family phenazine biosynthesis protein